MTADFGQFERVGWAGRGPGYTGGFGALTARCVPALLDAVDPCHGRLLIDVGTGTGIVAMAASARGASVIGVDESASMLRTAAGYLPRLLRGRVQRLPVRDASVDIVVGNCVVNHLPDPVAGLAELRRVLRPAGRLALTAWDMTGANEAISVVARAVRAAGVDAPDLPANPFAAHGDPAAFAALLGTAGLHDVTVAPVHVVHVVEPGAWWEALRSGTVMTSGQLAALDPASRQRVRAAYDDLVAAYVDADGLAHLPAAAWLAAGRGG
ncbi:MAG: class I SAM-dependent methyltransferase [Mycobacteriales bacterium]